MPCEGSPCWSIILLILVAGCKTAICPSGFELVGKRCTTIDAGSDAGACPQAGEPCGGIDGDAGACSSGRIECTDAGAEICVGLRTAALGNTVDHSGGFGGLFATGDSFGAFFFAPGETLLTQLAPTGVALAAGAPLEEGGFVDYWGRAIDGGDFAIVARVQTNDIFEGQRRVQVKRFDMRPSVPSSTGSWISIFNYSAATAMTGVSLRVLGNTPTRVTIFFQPRGSGALRARTLPVLDLGQAGLTTKLADNSTSYDVVEPTDSSSPFVLAYGDSANVRLGHVNRSTLELTASVVGAGTTPALAHDGAGRGALAYRGVDGRIRFHIFELATLRCLDGGQLETCVWRFPEPVVPEVSPIHMAFWNSQWLVTYNISNKTFTLLVATSEGYVATLSRAGNISASQALGVNAMGQGLLGYAPDLSNSLVAPLSCE